MAISAYNAVRPMIDASTQLRVATPADSDAVSTLLASSYSSLLRARYDSDTLDRTLPFMIGPTKNCWHLAPTMLWRNGPAISSGAEAGQPRAREVERSRMGKPTFVTLRPIPSGCGGELGLPCLLVASATLGNSPYAKCTAFLH